MAEDSTHLNIYEPTPGEGKLLDVLLNPDFRNSTVTIICEEAEIDRGTYYNAFKKPEFVEYYREQSKNLISHALGPVLNACIKAAKDGSHPHIKTILEMADLHMDKVGLVGADGKGISFTVNFVDGPKSGE